MYARARSLNQQRGLASIDCNSFAQQGKGDPMRTTSAQAAVYKALHMQGARRLARMAWLAYAAATSLFPMVETANAQSDSMPVPAEDQRMLPYVESGQLVDIGGRRINLNCTGAGGPTVIMMAGLF